jgi:hypothetical protein
MTIHLTAKGLYVNGVLMEKHHAKNAIAEHIKLMLFK